MMDYYLLADLAARLGCQLALFTRDLLQRL